MDRDNLLIGIGGLVVSVLAYFAGVLRTERQHARNDSEGRITLVLEAYMAASRAGKTNGFPGLIQAGVGTLKSDGEIRELIDRIVKHGQGWDPRPKLVGVDTRIFFEKALARKVNFYHAGVLEALVAELQTRGG